MVVGAVELAGLVAVSEVDAAVLDAFRVAARSGFVSRRRGRFRGCGPGLRPLARCRLATGRCRFPARRRFGPALPAALGSGGCFGFPFRGGEPLAEVALGRALVGERVAVVLAAGAAGEAETRGEPGFSACPGGHAQVPEEVALPAFPALEQGQRRAAHGSIAQAEGSADATVPDLRERETVLPGGAAPTALTCAVAGREETACAWWRLTPWGPRAVMPASACSALP